MTIQVTGVGRLNSEQVNSVLRSAMLAPSTHNTQPWLFRCTGTGIELHADPRRILPVTDPDGRELVLSCGAALFTLRTAIHALGFHPATTLMPSRADPDLLAVVRPLAERMPDPKVVRLARAIPRRRTNRRPFQSSVVPKPTLAALRHATELEHAWMSNLDTDQCRLLHDLTGRARRAQLADPAFLAELARWTGLGANARDGVPSYATEGSPADESWLLDEFGEAAGDTRPVPLVVAIGSLTDDRLDRLQAGQALQRVLLTATGAGLDASFISPPIMVREARAELRRILGCGVWPQVLLRVGYGSPLPWTPRRPLGDVLLDTLISA
ncbi:Acg family FMN-binding oxidoreductase [Amycolatopsis sp. EV170708-02-1]|uniref:Acg family FMN-binding oxidoreductase n=1 Tax=Amycolatopsis sp. EV170708-02-1 TaxID=2919322 RepID=UPI001F0C2E89|nr:nitroreductase family protein [Amycolatopsis sp. EV170708-02-1]UMP04463.1 nitroreductase family protein [Amycolatopsis sp. EV170708-02-1]